MATEQQKPIRVGNDWFFKCKKCDQLVETWKAWAAGKNEYHHDCLPKWRLEEIEREDKNTIRHIGNCKGCTTDGRCERQCDGREVGCTGKIVLEVNVPPGCEPVAYGVPDGS